MRRRLRQAGRAAAAASHHGARLAGAVLLALLLGGGVLAWRLAQRPIDIPPLAARIATSISRDLPDMQVTVGSAGLAWEGFHHGGAPLDLRVSDIVVRHPDGSVAATLSGLRMTLALPALLHGRIAPVLASADHVSLTLRPRPRTHNPTALPRLLAMLRTWLTLTPAQGALDLDSLQNVAVRDATVTLDDAADAIALAAHHAALSLHRTPQGALAGRLRADFRNATGASLPLAMTLAGSGRPRLRARLGPADPASLAPGNAELARFDLPMTLDAVIRPESARPAGIALTLGAGRIRVDGSRIAVAHGQARLAVAGGVLHVETAMIALAGGNGSGPVAHVAGRVALRRPWHGRLTARIGAVTVAALRDDWPAALAPDARRFVTTRIAAGHAADGVFAAGFDLDGAHGAALETFSGRFAARGITLDWFPGAPKLTGLAGTLVFPDRDHLRIAVTRGALGGLTLRHGSMTIDGLNRPEQTGRIVASVDGRVGAALAVLDAPPLDLTAHGVRFPGASGDVAATIHATLPLSRHVRLAQISLATKASLTSLHLPLTLPAALPVALPVATGRRATLALDGGNLDLDAAPDHLRLAGNGTLAGAPVHFDGRLRLPHGGLVITGRTRLTSGLAAAAGLPAAQFDGVSAPLDFTYRHDTAGAHLDLAADLTPVAAAIPPLGWRKSRGSPGAARARLDLPRSAPPKLETLSVTAPDLALALNRTGRGYRIARLTIGAATATGTMAPPARPGAPWLLRLDVPRLDLAPLLRASSRPGGGQKAASATQRPPPAPMGPPWQLDATVGSLALARTARAGTIGPVAITASGRGERLSALNANAALGAAAAAPRRQEPRRQDPRRQDGHLQSGRGQERAILVLGRDPGGLDFRLTSDDAGRLLAALDATDAVIGGALDLHARLPVGGAVTHGRLTMTGFRLPRAPTIGKILEAITIYGVPEATSGRGIEIDRLTAPFTLARGVIALHGAHAASAALGFTAAGRIDLAHRRLALGGTVVPAYALNSLPGRIPLIGRLFRAEKGGGMFAARFSLTGKIAHPALSVNPVSLLTPGVLRDMFGPQAPAASAGTPPMRQPTNRRP